MNSDDLKKEVDNILEEVDNILEDVNRLPHMMDWLNENAERLPMELQLRNFMLIKNFTEEIKKLYVLGLLSIPAENNNDN